jgi:uncharacterized protein YbjQ (UPF0145 family)
VPDEDPSDWIVLTMKLFSLGGSDSNDDPRRRQDEERLAAGKLPLHAEMRLREMKSRGNLFTSNLSVNEFLLTRQQGYRPLGQVMGSSIYHVGWQWMPVYQSEELVLVNHAYTQARLIALSRLQQEASLLGAHGVTGVRVERSLGRWGEGLLEFTVRGTAIALDGERPAGQPFLSDLTGQEYWLLREAGYHPVGFVFGSSRWYQIASFSTQWVMGNVALGVGASMNLEVRDYTNALYTARQFAVSRMNAEAEQAGAEGIVGVAVQKSIETVEVKTQNDQERTDLIVVFTAMGTAVVRGEERRPVVNYTMLLDR